jgi:hypothetical protein
MSEEEYDYSDGNEAEERHNHRCSMRDMDQGIAPSGDGEEAANKEGDNEDV